MRKQDVVDLLYEKLKSLSETIWERQHSINHIETWVNQFETTENILDDERIHALYLLTNFIYFGQIEIRALLVSLYRDLFKTPIIHGVRRANGDTTDTDLLQREFAKQLEATRFLGVGNPSESGVHLLYYFRQENSLPRTAFINSHEIFSRETAGDSQVLSVRDKKIERYVFIDDLCGSGTQAEQYSRDLVEPLRKLKPDVKIHYLVLFATDLGLKAVRDLNRYDYVASVFELDHSFKTLEPGSRIFSSQDGRYDRLKVRATCEKHGHQLWSKHPLGYKDGQLLLGFSHNTPDNTLPIFWGEGNPPHAWDPMFKRYHKNYG
ncbi:hypothetical protein [Mesorhizobium sp. ES1-1]|uniref:phosphoribosyltransferase-like protein n=1 Tax=Mesorhizobium sp. ES1-1 TaxID=2876629 RepID=UPI001CCF970B|nr:hypothetical protein [Mesorhizobium sp. ES1-1]MBZ9677812.1 hypothetical protein [Mesorhizobium sp. ES1-1]